MDNLVYKEILRLKSESEKNWTAIEADVKKWLRNKAGTEKQIAEMRTAVSNLEIDVENILMERINDKENRATYDRMLEKKKAQIEDLKVKINELINLEETVKKRRKAIKENIDMLSLSAHKFHGPKGIGVLYAKKGIILQNLIYGGAQERGKRAGTENIPAIMGMAAAFDEACDKIEANSAKLCKLRDRLIEGLCSIPHSILNGDAEKRLPGNVNVCFEGIEGESLLLLLDDKGIAASSGSACTSGSLDPSHVLLALGRPHEVAHGSLRLSLCEENTEEEVEYIIEAVGDVVSLLRGMSPVWRDLESGKKEFILK